MSSYTLKYLNTFWIQHPPNVVIALFFSEIRSVMKPSIENIKQSFKVLKRVIKASLMVLGALFTTIIILAFTDAPYYAHYNLGITGKNLSKSPDYIVVMGGSGMPSPDGLMRCYSASIQANKFDSAQVIIAHADASTDTNSQAFLMAKELILRGVDSNRIMFEIDGTNTKTQVENVCNRFLNDSSIVLIITSSAHMKRTELCFKKQGFHNVSGQATRVNTIAVTNLTNGNKGVANLEARYNLWSYLNYELVVAREYCALAYYKLRGWI